MKPPVLSSVPQASSASRLSPWAIAAICIASVVLFLGAAALIAGLLVRGRVVEARQERMQRVRAVEAKLSTFAQGQSEPGLTYTNIKVPKEPWSIHILKVDRSRKDLTIVSAHARNKVLGVSMLSDQARSVPAEFGRAIAAVNGDFYDRDNPTYAGDPRGLQIMNGELISAPDTACIWFDTEGNPQLDEVKGNFHVTLPV